MKAPGERARWRWILPSIIVSLSAILLLTSQYQQSSFVQNRKNRVEAQGGHWMYEGPEMEGTTTPAELAAKTIGGPGFVIGNLMFPRSYFWTSNGVMFDAGHLAGVGLFWVWIGWLLDTRKRPTPRTTRTYRVVWSAAYLFLIGFCSTVLYSDARQVFPLWSFRFFWKGLRTLGLYDRALMELAIGLWFAAGSAYFVYKLLMMWRTRRDSSGPIAGVSAQLVTWATILGLLGFVIGLPPKWTLYSVGYENVVGAVDGTFFGVLVWWVLTRSRQAKAPRTRLA